MRADLSSVTFQDRAVYEVFQGSVLQEGFPLLSTYQGVCAICLSWHQEGEEEEGEKRSGTILWYAAKGQEFMAVN